MPKLTILFLLSLVFSSAVLAQSTRISGKISDTAEKKIFPAAPFYYYAKLIPSSSAIPAPAPRVTFS